jgi:chromosome segregation ATPase
MIKKMVIAGGAVGLLVTVFLGRDVFSYLRTSTGYFKQSVYNSVPVEFQIQRARQMLKDLRPEVQKNMHLIAKEEVEVQRLESQMSDSEARLGKEKEQLTQLKTAAASGREEFKFAGRSYSIEQVRLDLVNRFQRYKTSDATLASLKQMCAARQRSLEAARQKLEGMLAAKRQLEVEIENLEARNQMVAAAKTTSNYQFDESQLGRVKELLSDLKSRLEVDERLVNSEGYFRDEIPVDQPTGDDIVEQVSKYFSEAKPKSSDLAKGGK